MNVAVFKQAQQAYQQGRYREALDGFLACADDLSGLAPADQSKFYHLIGNCYVKSGDALSAASAYAKALAGSPETRKPSLYVNLGTALLGAEHYDEALQAFSHALDYTVYATPYKAHVGIGAAQLKLGNTAQAGVAYREAAIDPTNPAPGKALVNLGVCFMELGRTDDAVVSYETALEFELDDTSGAQAHANLAQAYMAQGRVAKAIGEFERACAYDGFELSAIAKHDYALAQTLQERIGSKVPGIFDTGFIPSASSLPADEAPAEPDEKLPSGEMEPSQSGHLPVYGEPGFDPFAPQTTSFAPLDEEPAAEEPAEAPAPEPAEQDDAGEDESVYTNETEVFAPLEEGAAGGDALQIPQEASYGSTGEFEAADTHMPSPEDTDFFDITEAQIAQNAREGKRQARRARGLGLKIAITLVVICILLAAAVCAAYVLGYGYPLQESVAAEFISAVQSGSSTDDYWASGVDEASIETQAAQLEGIASYDIVAVERSMSQTTVYVTATLEEGGEVSYEFVMSRDTISWAIEYIELHFSSQQ